MSDLTPLGDVPGETLLPTPPADLAPLVDVIRAAGRSTSDEVAAAHIAAAAHVAREAAAPVAASVAAAAIDLGAEAEPAESATEANAGLRSARRRRRAVLVALPVAVLATCSVAAARLVPQDTGTTPPAALSTIGPGGPQASDALPRPGSPADPSGRGGSTTGTGAEPPDGQPAPTGPDGQPTTTSGTDGLDNAVGASPRSSTTTPTTATTAIGPPAATTTVRPPITPLPTPPRQAPTPTTIAPGPPGASRLTVLGGTSCGPGLRLTVPGTGLAVAGTIADNCDTTISFGTSVVADTLFVRGTFTAPGSVGAGVTRLQSPVPDPLSRLPGSVGGAPHAGGDIATAVTLQPGSYTSPITIKADGAVTLAPGVYDIPGLTMTAGARLSGAGVVLFIRDGGLHVEDCASVALSGPTAGTFAGLTIVQPVTNTNDLNISRTATCSWSFQGGIYAPGARVGVEGDLTFTLARVVVGSLVDLGPAHVSITG